MNTTLEPMLALFTLGGGEIVLLIAILLIFALVALVVVGLIIFLIVRSRGKGRNAEPPSAPAAKSPTPAQSTEVIPRKCPKCGAELKADAPEGLCPACLLQRGLATEGGAPPGTPAFTPPPIAELAKLFPQLEILEVIGQGGMGAVYKARQPALDRFVALKILAPRTGGDLDFSGRFSREARALARLNHPNIVGVYDFGTVSSPSPSEKPEDKPGIGTMPVLHYFIMEYVDGPNLRQVEQAGKLTPREALQIIPQICAALQFAHDEGIVHRDIKPENVLLDKKGRVKIADFGLAKILGQEADFRLTGARDVMGTPHYMAPEQVETPQEVDHRADIYSLGVVFYEMLTGELPLGKFDPPSHKVQIDVRLDDVVMRSLSKNPERRYQHVSEVRTELESIAETPADAGKSSQQSQIVDAMRSWLTV
ncbi:MAG TPA: serine/threonine-protein kinase, partial [Verrucomicrobiae bacterium]